MEINRFLRNLDINAAPPSAPRVLLYIPPSGRAIHCRDLDQARATAEDLAAERPGRTVAVYQLVGYAHQPIHKPEFQDTEEAMADLADAPDEFETNVPPEGHSDIDRTDLTPEQQERLNHVREVMRGEPAVSSTERSDG